MISITSILYNNSDPFVFEEGNDTSFGTLSSRVSRVATLDGGSEIINSGTTEGDRTITIKAEITARQSIEVEALRTRNAIVNLSSNNGLYYGAIQSINTDNGNLTLIFLVNKKIA